MTRVTCLSGVCWRPPGNQVKLERWKLAFYFCFSGSAFWSVSLSGIVCRLLYRGPCSWACIVLPDRPLCTQTEWGGRRWGGGVPAAVTPPASLLTGHTHTHTESRSPGCKCRLRMDQNHSGPTGALLHSHVGTHSQSSPEYTLAEVTGGREHIQTLCRFMIPPLRPHQVNNACCHGCCYYIVLKLQIM